MIKKIFAVSAIAALTLVSCKKENLNTETSTGTDSTAIAPMDSTKQSAQDSLTVNETKSNDIVKTSIADKNGKKLEMTFDNSKNTATLLLDGETIELQGQKAASGIWYKNDHYELRGKGSENELLKDGKLIFKSEK